MSEQIIAARLAKLRQQRTAPLILEIDLTDGITETRPADPVTAIMARHRLVLADVLDGLRRARDDDRVRALVVRLGGQAGRAGHGAGTAPGRARVQRRPAKPTVAFAESFGEFSAGNVGYYLATAFDTIWLQPSGDLGLTGIAVERVFLRGALDKLGADFQVAKRHEYKSAAEQLTEHGFSAPAREETERLTASVTEQLAERHRRAPEAEPAERVSELINAGPFLATARRWSMAWSTRWATATRCTPASGGRPVTARRCCTWAATSGPRALADRARKLPARGSVRGRRSA